MKKVGLMLMTLVLFSCEGEAPNSFTPTPKQDPQQTTTGTGGGVAAKITLGVTPSTLIFGGTASVIATVTTAQGGIVPNGTIVSFLVVDSALGTITPIATTANGTATALFIAKKVSEGTTTLTASSGVATQSATIDVKAPTTGSIEFLSASPQIIGLRGSGQTETSVVTFLVKDVQGNPVKDGISVVFTLSGPQGGEYIGTSTGLTTALAATKDGGKASVILNSGFVAGPANIEASVTLKNPDTGKEETFSSVAPAISMGGGLVSATHFNLAANPLNLPGLVFSNEESDISAYAADRYGNFNVLKGTVISFYTEAGAIDRTGIMSEKGLTSVKLRTQDPLPADILPGNLHPVDGHVTVLATVMGEEAFNDLNGNGRFDMGEPFTDLPEPFLDKNNNKTRDIIGLPVLPGFANPFEEYIDVNKNESWDPPNGFWDGPGCKKAQNTTQCEESKMIWTEMTLAFTGNPGCRFITGSGFDARGGSVLFTVRVGDINNNIPIAGTTIKVDSTKGTLAGEIGLTVADGVGGPLDIQFSLSDEDATTTEPTTVTVTVTPPKGLAGCVNFLSGTI